MFKEVNIETVEMLSDSSTETIGSEGSDKASAEELL